MNTIKQLPINPAATQSILDRLFTSVKTAPDGQTSLINLYDYVDFLLKNHSTKVVIGALEKQQAEDYKTYYHLKAEAEKELKKSKKMLLGILSKNKVENPELDSKLESLERFENGEISMSGIYVTNLEHFLYAICQKVLESGRRDLIEHFIDGTRVPHNIFGDFSFSKSLPLLYKERDRIENVKKIEIWECWQKLKFVPEISRLPFNEIMNAEVQVTDEEVDYFIGFLILKQEVGKGEVARNYQDDLAKYKNHLTRLHNYFIQKLTENNTQPPKQLDNLNKDKNHQKKINYEYSSHGSIFGKLAIGELSPLQITKIPASIVNYFYSLAMVGDFSEKNYKDFNEQAGQNIDSDEFSKKITAINDRVRKFTKGIIKELIIKGETNSQQEPNIYRWNNKL